ncbi:MAG TPA: ABC transporter ATP-binding protein [Gaiellaceae bacterium]|nr:ABC transporter ATP-binding protein [Gaiellaceae bacterium]
MRTAIEIEGLGKRYRLGTRSERYDTLREAVARRIRRRGRQEDAAELWALRGVDLAIDEGDVVGIVGRNGAGKTTLLKLVAGIAEPTTGMVRTRGRIAALLDLGTAFHPELTGRENVYLNGAVLGMSRREIARRFDDIVAFADVERFLSTPLKRYSTGMQLRLAFAVAAHLDADIVVVDELLAVGDAEFQRRCLGKMSEFGRDGRTVVFVSHDMASISQLCRRGIWLDRGVVRADGPVGDVLDLYLGSRRERFARVEVPPEPDQAVQLLSVALTDAAGREIELPRRDEPLVVRLRFRARERIPALDVALYLLNRQGVRVIDDAWLDGGAVDDPVVDAGDYEAHVRIPPVLAPGEYTAGVWIGTNHEDFLDREVLSFEVAPRPDDRLPSVSRRRVVQPDVCWTLRSVSRRSET